MAAGRTETAATELSNVQTAVGALMKDANADSLVQGTFSSSQEFSGGTSFNLSSYIIGGLASVHGTYSIETDGSVNQTGYTY